MRSLWTATAFVLLAAAAANLRAETPGREEVARQVGKRFRGIKDISADFKYTSYIKILDERRTDTGRLLMKRPDKFRIELEYLVLVSDGESIWNYTPENGQALKSALDRSPEVPRISDIVFNFEKTYRIDRVREEGRKFFAVTLVPLQDVDGIAALDVWVGKKDWLPYKVTYGDADGNTREYTLTNIKLNSGLQNGQFVFEPPAGVELFETF